MLKIFFILLKNNHIMSHFEWSGSYADVVPPEGSVPTVSVGCSVSPFNLSSCSISILDSNRFILCLSASPWFAKRVTNLNICPLELMPVVSCGSSVTPCYNVSPLLRILRALASRHSSSS